MKIKKLCALFLSFALVFTMTACTVQESGKEDSAPSADSAAPSDEGTAETVIYTDSLGRDVEVPANITRIVPSAPLGQMYLFALCPDYFVGMADEWSEASLGFLPEKYTELPVVGQLYGGKGELNLETLAMTEPQVIIDVGEPKDSTGEELDALQEQLNIPCIHITATTETAGEAFRELGRFLGLEEEAEVLAVYCESAYAEIVALMEKVGEENKKDIIYCPGADGLNVIGKGSYHAEVIDLLGNNVAVIENPTSKGTGDAVDAEQILLWDPEVIFFSPEVNLDEVVADPAWGELNAIRSGNYHKTPEGPYNWMGFPPSVNRYLGMYWMASILYPEQAQFDLYEKVSEYYELFYHSELTVEFYQELTA